MAKRKNTRKKKSQKYSPEHVLPEGFWSQAGAVGLIALSILLVISWFGAGGPVLDWMYDAGITTVGYGIFVAPVVFIYLAVEIFRSDEDRLPIAMKLAAGTVFIWLSGLFGLMGEKDASHGGFVGETLNKGVLALVDTPIAAFLYVLLIIFTALFIIRISFRDILDMLRGLFGRSGDEDDFENIKIMEKASKIGDKEETEFKLNAGVPMLNDKDKRAIAKQPKEVSEDTSALVSVVDPNWQAPSLELLEKKQSPADPGDIKQNADIIKDTLAEFGIDVDMEGANIGPKVTQYTLRPPSGIKLARIAALETNIALNLAVHSLRIEAPIPGKKAVGIEVPNQKPADVRIHGILESKQWKAAHESLSFAVGKDISGDSVIGELNRMPHLLIAGQTGSGKSVMINTLLTSLLYRNSPSDMKLILVDPKEVEMAFYEDIPHLLTPIITEPEKAISALRWSVNEMQRRYKLLAAEKTKDIDGYNRKVKAGSKRISVQDEAGNPQEVNNGAMPHIVIVVDELFDFMMAAGRDLEALIARLAAKSRAVGIHLVLATQRPDASVITGLIKANVPARIAFTVASQLESRIIIDQGGAEKLLGNGDMLLYEPRMTKPKRIQGAWITEEEVQKVTDHLRMQSAPQYNDEIISQPVQLNGKGGVAFDNDMSGDNQYNDALRIVIETGKASTSYLQRRLSIGYSKAAKFIDMMEEQGVIGEATGSGKPRDVLVTSMDELDGGDMTDDDLG